ncbi:diaminopimelate epimerase [Cellulosilyticum lentocellum DSM 5427]|uniref:Diaminopimelate epimerase n=1 Tax=Cellulosilyticum lentocellum (strain ATCC 49066 / DSM 5427 / NCIMB 11756 / RHM5) TaxID=642492 RepID=F2JNN0_CELLD|nr:diaminopimelate epimerase [Cellulosilyticum lentocellum]ADZ85919.1 diaminopimelate epimerase [Cellulosilyticum lentocellum DSM 5427]
MKINFTKMHGIGNDYVYVDGFKQTLKDPNAFSEFISDRHFGIGSDGLVIILPSEIADFRMRMFNADGSEGKMCGNATRCIGKFVYETGYTDKKNISLETLSGIKYLTLTVEDGKVVYVEVDMGKAILSPQDIPVISDQETFINTPISIDNEIYYGTCVSMGNPHVVVYCEDVDLLSLESIGPKFEFNPLFPERINTEFVQIIDDSTVKMRVWERGSGETWACGTGACAVAVSCVLNGYCKINEEITVKLRGGDLKITYKEDGTVLMKGPATKVFDGTIEYEEA